MTHSIPECLSDVMFAPVKYRQMRTHAAHVVHASLQLYTVESVMFRGKLKIILWAIILVGNDAFPTHQRNVISWMW